MKDTIDILDALELVTKHMSMGSYYEMLDSVRSSLLESSLRGVTPFPLTREYLIRNFVSEALDKAGPKIDEFVSHNPKYADLLREAYRTAERCHETFEINEQLKQQKKLERIFKRYE